MNRHRRRIQHRVIKEAVKNKGSVRRRSRLKCRAGRAEAIDAVKKTEKERIIKRRSPRELREQGFSTDGKCEGTRVCNWEENERYDQ